MLVFWKRVIEIGIWPGLEPATERKVRLINSILIAGIFLLLIVFSKSLILNKPEEYLAQLSGIILFSIPLILNYFRKYNLSQYLTLLIPIIYLSSLTLYWGSSRGSQLILFAVVGLSILIFEKKRIIFTFLCLAALCLILVEVFNFYYNPYYIIENPEYDYIINIILTVVMIGMVTGIFKKENYAYQNNIRSFSEKLERQHSRLLELNKDLTSSLDIIERQKEEIDRAHQDLQDSIIYAGTIQKAMMTGSKAMDTVVNDCFILLRPKDIVSGDFYYIYHREPRIFIASVDCTGHGVPGALMSMLGYRLLQETIEIEKREDPGEILTIINKRISHVLKQESNANMDGMDISIISFDPIHRNLLFAGAKASLHVISDGKATRYKGDSFSLGGFTPLNHVFSSKSFELSKGDSFYLMSDGLQDQFGGPMNKKFNSRRISDLLERVHMFTMDFQKQLIKETMDSWSGPTEQTDDILIIGIKA